MIVVVDGAEQVVRMEQAETLTELSVELRACSRSQADLLLEGVGHLDGEHAWLDIASLKKLSPQQGRADWASGFDAAMDYARSQGWMDISGAVRAHVSGRS